MKKNNPSSSQAPITENTLILKPDVFTVIIVDDQSTGRLLVSEILRGISPNAEIVAFGNPLEAIEYATAHHVDLILTDYRMPGIDGIETIRRLRQIDHIANVPIICVTIVDDREVKYRALEAGATDFLKRPLDRVECATRCKNLLALRRHQLLHHDYTKDLEFRIEEVLRDVLVNEMEILQRLAKVAEQRDSFTGQHLIRMAQYSAILAKAAGWSTKGQLAIELASPLHDIGKIGIPDAILQARRRLTDEEIVIMRTHTNIGHEMLQGSDSRYMQMAAAISYAHHEKFDGSGYPHGIVGRDIPEEARIVAIADVYDALTSVRPYKQAWSAKEATAYMVSERDKHFDAELLDLFFTCMDELERVRLTFGDPDTNSLPR